MVENTIKSVIKAEHKLENIVESSNDNSADMTEKELQKIRRLTEQLTLSAVRISDNWGKQSFDQTKEKVEDICL